MTLMSGPGDQTAGLIWMHSVSPQSPLWGFTHATNYPLGEQLSSPVQASGVLEYLLYWVLASLAGSVCGYNLLNLLGFVSGALIMFGFIRWLTRKSWVALLAGFAVSFTPYLQIKTAVHPSYAYQGLLIAIIWVFLVFWKRPRIIPALAISVLAAASFYLDPYFVLLAGVLLVGLLFGGIGHDILRKVSTPELLRKTKYIGLSLGVFILLLLPLIYIRVHYSAAITNVVSNSRNDIKFDAMIYGAHPFEYLEPVETQPILKKYIPNYALNRNRHSSNPSEYSINLSLTLLTVIVVAACIWLWRWRRTKRADDIDLNAPVLLVIGSVVLAGGLAFAFSLAPVIHGYKMPSWYLTNYITMWRVFARLAIVVNITMIIVASIGLTYLATKITSRWVKYCLYVLIAALVAFEYMIQLPPRTSWSYKNDVPSVYYRLHDRTDVHVIAEYSLDEPATTAMTTFFISFQFVHGKQMINSDIAGSPQAPMRGALRDIEDPQTLPALRTLGADTVVIHGVDHLLNIPGLELIDYEQSRPAMANPAFGDPPEIYPIWVYRISSGVKGTSVLAPETGFVYPKKDSPVSYDFVGGSKATLKLLNLPGEHQKQGTACFAIKALGKTALDASVVQKGQKLWSGNLNGEWQQVKIPVANNEPITITDTSSNGVSFTLDDLGCRQ